MNLIRLSVDRPVGVTVAVLALLLVAASLFTGIRLDLLPDLELPYAVVVTVYPGADPETVEADVTAPLEDVLATVAGITRLRSTSLENVSVIIAELAWGSDIDAAVRTIDMNAGAIAGLLPAGTTAPVVLQADPSQLPLMLVAVSGPGDALSVTETVHERILPRLQRIPGVAAVNVLGGEYPEISVRYDSEALASHGMTPIILQQALALQNTVVPAGALTTGDIRYQVKAGNRIESLDDLRNQPIGLRQPGSDAFGLLGLAGALPVRLGEVADIDLQPRPREGVTRVNGASAVILRILKQSGENSMAVVSRVEEELDALANERELGLSFHTLTSQADLIGNSLRSLASAGALGGGLAVAVLFLFLRSIQSIALIAFAIPLSVVAALVVLQALGVTLNQLSLGGIALAVGMLVDNAIIVIENIFRHRGLGKAPKSAAIEGGSEMGGAIFASTVTTIVVFLPILFVESLAGRLFHDMGISVTAALVASLIIALTVVPSAAARLMRAGRRRSPAPAELPTPVEAPYLEAAAASEGSETRAPKSPGQSPFSGFQRLRAAYARSLETWIRRRWLTVGCIVLFGAALVLLPQRLEMQFLPATDGGLITAELTLPAGTPAREAIEEALRLEQEILAMPEVTTVALFAGDQGNDDVWALLDADGTNRVGFTIVLAPRSERSRSSDEVAAAVAALPVRSDARLILESDRVSASLGDDFYPGVTLEVTGADLNRLKAIADEIVALLDGIDGLGSVHATVTESHPQIFFDVTERSFQGILTGGEPLTAGQVGLAVRNHLTGATATRVTIDGRRLPVVLRPQESETESLESLSRLRIPGASLATGGGNVAPVLERIATVTTADGPTAIYRLDRSRLATVRAELDGIGFNAARERVSEALARLDLPDGYHVRIAGLHRVIDESVSELMWVLVLAVGLVYAVMAAQFESFRQPLIIFITVPLALVGALTALILFGLPLSVPAAIGLIVLVGIAVNNGIVMVDYTNRLREAGMPPVQAAIEAASVRLRPILMTSLTTLFGLLPLVFFASDGSELQRPVAVAVIGGLVTSTALSLFVVPGLYVIASRVKAEGESRRPGSLAVGILALTGAALLFAAAPGKVAAASAAGGRLAMASIVMQEGEAPDPVIGLSASWRKASLSFGGRLTLGRPDGSGQRAALFASVASRAGATPFTLSTEIERRLQPGAPLRFNGTAAWRGRQSEGRAALRYAGAESFVHPWTGRSAPRPGWRFETAVESTVSPPSSWMRSAVITARPGAAPEWLLLSGPKWEEQSYGGFVQAGLLLSGGAYTPLFRFGGRLSLLPRGEIDLTIGPVAGEAPDDWPLFSLGLETAAAGFGISAQFEAGAAGSGFSRRSYLRLQPQGRSAYAIVTWTQAAASHGTVALHFPF